MKALGEPLRLYLEVAGPCSHFDAVHCSLFTWAVQYMSVLRAPSAALLDDSSSAEEGDDDDSDACREVQLLTSSFEWKQVSPPRRFLPTKRLIKHNCNDLELLPSFLFFFLSSHFILSDLVSFLSPTFLPLFPPLLRSF